MHIKSHCPTKRSNSLGITERVFILLLYVFYSLFGAGTFAPHFAAVLKRIFGFFGNLKVSVGFAIKCYFEDIKSDGAVFLIVLSVTALTAYAAYTGVRDFISLWIS